VIADFRSEEPSTERSALPIMEVLGLAELEHNPKNNRMRALYADKNSRV
jgi:hypothetical protein